MRAGTGSSARIGTHKSCPFVLLRVRVDVHRVYEYPRMHLLYCGLELEEARRIIRVAFGGVSSSAAMRVGDWQETEQDAPSPCQITRGRGFKKDKTSCVGLARAPIAEARMSMPPYFISSLTGPQHTTAVTRRCSRVMISSRAAICKFGAYGDQARTRSKPVVRCVRTVAKHLKHDRVMIRVTYSKPDPVCD